ncbi:MAG: hypothetical protein ACRCWC_03455 [Plesiomonas shigelloides]
MQIEMLQDVVLSDGVLRIGVVDVPDNLAAALIYQGVSRAIAPPQVAAVVQPEVKVKRRQHDVAIASV